MSNIYVDEQPETCEDCEFCEYFGKDAHGKGKHEVACYLNGFLTNALLGDTINAKHCSHIKLLSDRLAEERKKVVQEIWKEFEQRLMGKTKDMPIMKVCNMINSVLDQVEKGEK